MTYRVAPAEASGLDDASCDLVVAAQAAHWFDLPRYWAEVARVLKPGGLAALVGYGLLRIDPSWMLSSMLSTRWGGPARVCPSGGLSMAVIGKIDFPFRADEFELT